MFTRRHADPAPAASAAARRRAAAAAPPQRRGPAAAPTAPSSTGCGTPASSPATRSAPTPSSRPNPGLRSTSRSTAGTTTGPSSPPGFIADTAPDVFTDHLSKFAQFADLKVLRPLDELGPTSGHPGRRLPARPGRAVEGPGRQAVRHTEGLGHHRDLLQQRTRSRPPASTRPQLRTCTWNPTDGGTFEKIVAHLTVDANGKRGDEPGFDKNQRQDLRARRSDGSGGGGWGQTQWSAFTGSAGWQATDKNPWGTHFNLDQPAFQDTMSWYFGLVDEGLHAQLTPRSAAPTPSAPTSRSSPASRRWDSTGRG